mgnify:CR=1 FL=1
MKIRTVNINNRKKSFEIDTPKGRFSLPFSKLRLAPTPENKVKEAYVDRELDNRAITYVLKSGEEDSVHLDAFLDYNKDPEYMTKISLYKLTLNAIDLVEKSKLGKREIARKLKTSPAQLYRLIDTTNYSKTIDQMVKLLASLGCQVDFVPKENPWPTANTEPEIKAKFPYLSDSEIREIPKRSFFRALSFSYQEAA